MLDTPFGPGALYGAKRLIAWLICSLVMFVNEQTGSGYTVSSTRRGVSEGDLKKDLCKILLFSWLV